MDLCANEGMGTSAVVDMHKWLVIPEPPFVCHEINRSAINGSGHIPGVVYDSTDILLIFFFLTNEMIGMEILNIKNCIA